MAVIFSLKPVPWPTSSNKQEGGESQKSKKYDISYSYDVPGKGKVHVTAPFIDRISITVPVTSNERQGMIVDMLNLDAKDDENPHVKHAEKKGGYKYAADIVDPKTNEKVLVQACPTNPGISFARLEFNPARLGADGVNAFKVTLAYLSNGALTWSDVLNAGKATRIDATVDLLNVPMAALLCQSQKVGKLHIYVGPSGEPETLYSGIALKGKNSNQLVYDKAQHEMDKDLPADYGGNRARVEMIYKYPNQMLSKIASIKTNPFEWVTIFHPFAVPAGIDELSWSLFLDSCRLRGVTNAKTRIPDDMREIIELHLDAVAATTWKPKKLWNAWPAAVKKSALLEPGPTEVFSLSN